MANHSVSALLFVVFPTIIAHVDGLPKDWGDLLVLYSIVSGDRVSLENLRFFLQESVPSTKRCDHVLLIQAQHLKAYNDIQEALSDPMPANFHPVAVPEAELSYCSTLAADHSAPYRWALWRISNGYTAVHPHAKPLLPRPLSSYRYMILIDSSVRGPFIPPIVKDLVPWCHPFLSRLNDKTALVGSTISCQGGVSDEDVGIPRVQSAVLAMTMDTTNLLIKEGVLDCNSGGQAKDNEARPEHNVNNLSGAEADEGTGLEHRLEWELSASVAVLGAGLGLDCLMIRYQGVDWQDAKNWGCNAEVAPQGEFAYDGINLDPFETVFALVDDLSVRQERPAAVAALKYDSWMHGISNIKNRVLGNRFSKEGPKYKAPKILEKLVHDKGCFDFAFYLRRNKDLVQGQGPRPVLNISNPDDVWEHFVYHGQFEPRQFRFICPMNYQQFAGFKAFKGN